MTKEDFFGGIRFEPKISLPQTEKEKCSCKGKVSFSLTLSFTLTWTHTHSHIKHPHAYAHTLSILSKSHFVVSIFAAKELCTSVDRLLAGAGVPSRMSTSSSSSSGSSTSLVLKRRKNDPRDVFSALMNLSCRKGTCLTWIEHNGTSVFEGMGIELW